MNLILAAATTTDIVGPITESAGVMALALAALIPVGLGIGLGVNWAVPKAKQFFKKVAS